MASVSFVRIKEADGSSFHARIEHIVKLKNIP